MGSHLFNLVLLGVPVILGLRPSWSVEWLALPLIPLALCFWGIVGYFIFRQIRRGVPEKWFLLLCVGISATLFAAFLFTSFGIDPSGRYFIPLVVPMTLMAGTFLTAQEKPKWLKWILFALIVVFQAWGTIQCVGKNSPGLTTQFYAPTIIDHRYDGQLIEFLKANGEDRGYTTYWVSYPLAFLSDENLIFIPRLPYHDDFRYTVRDDRYAPYTEEVAGSDHAAYITAGSPWLDEYLRYHFSQLGVQWKEQSIGDFRVFYRISRKVMPQAIGLGDSTNP